MIQVFRVEHCDTRIGPFQTDDEFTQFLAENTNGPTPNEDGIPFSIIPWYYKFGCIDIKTLCEWFKIETMSYKNVLRRLNDLGFVVREYLVEDDCYMIGKSKKQVAFDADLCYQENLVETHDMGKLLKGD